MPNQRGVKCAVSVGAILAAVVLVAAGSGAAGAMTRDETEIRDLLTNYENALNTSSTVAAMLLYTEDGIVMPPYQPSVVGKARLTSLYEAGSKIFTLHVTFSVKEVVRLSPTWAFARTTSEGIRRDIATGATTDEANQELFILRKSAGGAWRIARYSFSSTNPPPH